MNTEQGRSKDEKAASYLIDLQPRSTLGATAFAVPVAAVCGADDAQL